MFDLATVLGNGGQPLLVFHEIAAFLSRIFATSLSVRMNRRPPEHQDGEEDREGTQEHHDVL